MYLWLLWIRSEYTCNLCCNSATKEPELPRIWSPGIYSLVRTVRRGHAGACWVRVSGKPLDEMTVLLGGPVT